MIPDSAFFVLAHNIRSLHNVGSIFRTSDVFGVDGLFLSGYTGHPPDPKLEKVSLGAEKTVPWEYKKAPGVIIRGLKKQYPDLTIVGLENNLTGHRQSKMLPRYKTHFPTLLMVGEEVDGISRNLLKYCDQFVEIPQLGTKESLNVSVAFGIAAYAIQNSRKS